MKIALTGSSSTGKTTLARLLRDHAALSGIKYLSADSRKLLQRMGYRSMDLMTRQQLREFQVAYLHSKLDLESNIQSYITDRSTVDVAAYWLIRDTFDLPDTIRDEYIEKCRNHASKYDLHIYLPFGLLPFEFDGYRSHSLEFHEQIDKQIMKFLKAWKIKYITLDMPDLDIRLQRVLDEVKRSHV